MLDNIVDYLTYVFVPVLLHAARRAAAGRRSRRGRSASRCWWPAATASAAGDAKVATTDYFFTGLPSSWNIVAPSTSLWRLAPCDQRRHRRWPSSCWCSCRSGYVYPSRTKTWRTATLFLGITWAVCFTMVIWRLPASGRPVDASFAGVPGLLPPAVGPTQRC